MSITQPLVQCKAESRKGIPIRNIQPPQHKHAAMLYRVYKHEPRLRDCMTDTTRMNVNVRIQQKS